MTREEIAEKYKGVKKSDMTHLSEIGYYNNNYFAYKGDLLFLHSCDDEMETQWYLVGNEEFRPIGYSYLKNDDLYICDFRKLT